jgi:hypothetical protein
MILHACEIFPTAKAMPEQLKRLGRSLVVALAYQERAYCNVDLQALRDLLAGEMPRSRSPLPEEVLAALDLAERQRIELLLGPGSGRPSVYITAWGEDWRHAIELLRQKLPPEVVDEVQVYGAD